MDGTSVVSGDVTVSGGTLTLAEDQSLSVNALSNSAALVLEDGATLTGTGNTFTNSGTVTIGDGGALVDAGEINNTAGGQITFAGDGTLNADSDDNSAGAEDILNAGTLTINAGAGGTTQTVAVGNDALENSGTLAVNSGTLNGITTLTNSGDVTVAAGATLGFDTLAATAGTVDVAGTLAGDLDLSGSGALDLSGTLSGDLTQTAGTATIDGTSSITGAVQITGGSFDVDETLTLGAGLANAGTLDIDADVLGDQTLSNSGTLTLAGDVTGTVSQTAGSTTVDGTSAVSGGFDIEGGTLTIDAATTADIDIAAGASLVVNSALTGNITNAGALDLQNDISGTWTQNGNDTVAVSADGLSVGSLAFNAGTLSIADATTFNVGDNGTSQEDAVFASGSSLILGQGATIAMAQAGDSLRFDSGSSLIFGQDATLTGHSILNGAVNAEASGIVFDGNVTVGSSAVVDMANGTSGDVVTVNGALTGNGGTVSLDVDLADGAQTADTIVATGHGLSSGTLHLVLEDQTTADTYGATEAGGLVLVDLEAGSTVTATVDATSFPTDNRNTYNYTLGNNSDGDIVLISQLNNAAAGLTGAIASAQSLVASVINRPTSPFVTTLSKLNEGEKCRPGGWARVVGGTANATGTATTATSSVETTTEASFGGIQVGLDSTCFNSLLLENGWDVSYGIIAGYNTASADQPIPGTGATAGMIDSVTELDMGQAYAGGYVVAARGRFSLDVQARAEKTDFTVNSSGLNPLAVDDTEFDTTAYTLSAAASYALSIPNQPNLFFVPTAGLSWTRTSDADFMFNDGSQIELDASTTAISFVGGTLARTMVNEANGARSAAFATLTHYVNLSDDAASTFIDTSDISTAIRSSALPDYTEISLGYTYNRELRSDRGSLRKFSASIRADGRFGQGFDSYGLTGQIRLQF